VGEVCELLHWCCMCCSWTSWVRQRWWNGLTTRTLWSSSVFVLGVNQSTPSWSSCYMVCHLLSSTDCCAVCQHFVVWNTVHFHWPTGTITVIFTSLFVFQVNFMPLWHLTWLVLTTNRVQSEVDSGMFSIFGWTGALKKGIQGPPHLHVRECTAAHHFLLSLWHVAPFKSLVFFSGL